MHIYLNGSDWLKFFGVSEFNELEYVGRLWEVEGLFRKRIIVFEDIKK